MRVTIASQVKKRMDLKKNKMKEIWKDIKGYEGFYKISNYGNVKSLSRVMNNRYKNFVSNEKMMKLSNDRGYLKVHLCKNSIAKCFRVHRLVYITFIGELKNNKVIDHIDNDKQNNSITNLQQITPRLNIIKSKVLLKSTSKYTGVSWSSNNNKWHACIEVNGKTKHLGLFSSEDDARDCYINNYNMIENNNFLDVITEVCM